MAHYLSLPKAQGKARAARGEANRPANLLSRVTTVEFPHRSQRVLLELVDHPSVDPEAQVLTVQQSSSEDWTLMMQRYLKNRELPQDLMEAKKISFRDPRYILEDGELYKRSFGCPLLKYLDCPRGVQVLEEIHTGDCGGHLGARSLLCKALRQGYYWLTMQYDAMDLVRECQAC